MKDIISKLEYKKFIKSIKIKSKGLWAHNQIVMYQKWLIKQGFIRDGMVYCRKCFVKISKKYIRQYYIWATFSPLKKRCHPDIPINVLGDNVIMTKKQSLKNIGCLDMYSY
uniref:Uncharacterized protein n=1 Tax=viral metagenome TaxID=1070528 RepID=A0A6M3XGT5_9ZZZZ